MRGGELEALIAARAALEGAIRRLGGVSLARMPPPLEHYEVRVSPPRRGRDRGCWVLRIFGPGLSKYGRRELTRIQHCRETRGKAEAAARSRAAKLNESGLPLLEVFQRWSASRLEEGRLSPSSLEGHKAVISWLESSGHGALVDGALRASRVMELRRDLGKGRKVSTGRLYLRLMAQAWKWARVCDLVIQPWPDLPKWRTPVKERSQKRALTTREVLSVLRHFAEYAGGRYLGLAWILAETACRVGAALKLQVGDVTVGPEGVGRVHFRAEHSKTNRSHYSLISPRLVGALDLGRPESAPLFPSAIDPSRPVVYGTFRGAFVLWARAEGLYGVVGIHGIRSHGATELTRAEVHPEKGRRVTGHASAEQFTSYASKGEYDLSNVARILWLDPLSQDVDQDSGASNGAALTQNPDSTRSLQEKGSPVVSPRCPKDLVDHYGPLLRSTLGSRPAMAGAVAILASLGGGGAES